MAGSGGRGGDTDASTPGGGVPGGRVAGGKEGSGIVAPTPPGAGVLAAGVVVEAGLGSALTLTLPDAAAGEAASGEVAVAVRTRRVPVCRWGAATCATSSTGWLEAATGQVAVPGHGQTVKVGESLPGVAAMPVRASPVVVPANQTQTA